MNPVRVRFAPSPTGPLHIGGLRTALYNYLFAKNREGTFILRVEDTDQKRYVEGAEAYIREALQWAGLRIDEGPEQGGAYGPYRQSERKEIYQEHIKILLANGSAYYAFDTAEEIDEMRRRLEAEGVHSPKYNFLTRNSMRNSLTCSKDEVSCLIEENAPYTIRLKVDPSEQIEIHDIIREKVVFNSSELDDKVLIKSDGLPTYHMANVVDDHAMKISHVIRGEEWLSSTAHHVLLYRAFGWQDSMPQFAHLPLILKPTGKGKLSKRDGQKLGIPVFPMDWQAEDGLYRGFKELGFLPEAIINFLAFLGWNPGTEKELYSLQELINDFSLSQVSRGGARFDFDKAKWFNQQYIIKAPPSELVKVLQQQLAEKNLEKSNEFCQQYVELFQPRLESLNELYEVGYYFFEDIRTFNEKMIRKKWRENEILTYNYLIRSLEDINDWRAIDIKSQTEQAIQENQSSFGGLLPLLRIATTGDVKGADLFQSLELMGRQEVMRRLNQASQIFEDIVA